MKHVATPSGEPMETPSFAALAVAVHPAWHQAIIRLANATERVAFRLEVLEARRSMAVSKSTPVSSSRILSTSSTRSNPTRTSRRATSASPSGTRSSA